MIESSQRGCAASAFLLAAAILATPARADPPAQSCGGAIGACTQAGDLIVASEHGPALWLAAKDGHEIWVLGLQNPIDKNLHWNSNYVARVVEQADVVMFSRVDAEFAGGVDGPVSAALRTRQFRRPGDAPGFGVVLPFEDYLAARAIGRDLHVSTAELDRYRATGAARFLYWKALDAKNLQDNDRLYLQIQYIARARHKILLDFTAQVIGEPKAIADDIAAITEIDGLPCFRPALALIDADVPIAAQKAKAWAKGDVATIRRLLDAEGGLPTCADPLYDIPVFSALRTQVRTRIYSRLLELAATNRVVFFVTDIANVLDRQDGLLHRLEGLGYRIDGP